MGEEPLSRVELRAVGRLGYVEEVALQFGLVQGSCVRGVVVADQDRALPRVVLVPDQDVLDEVRRRVGVRARRKHEAGIIKCIT